MYENLESLVSRGTLKIPKPIPRSLYLHPTPPPQICVVVEFNPIKYNMCSCTQHTHMTHELRVYHRHRHRVPVNLKTPTATSPYIAHIRDDTVWSDCAKYHNSTIYIYTRMCNASLLPKTRTKFPYHLFSPQPIQHTRLIHNTLWKGNWTITTACSIEL